MASVTPERWGLGFLLAMTLAGAGCGYFRPADPEPPSGMTVVPNYGSPDDALDTIALAIADKGRSNGQSAYIGAFADTAGDIRAYHGFFDPATLQRASQDGNVVPDPWDRIQEESFYSRFVRLSTVPANSDFVLYWEPDPTQGEDEPGTDRQVLHREYQGFAVSGSQELPIARGFVTLEFVKMTATRWAIVRWQDREDATADFSAGERSFGQRRLEPQSQ